MTPEQREALFAIKRREAVMKSEIVKMMQALRTLADALDDNIEAVHEMLDSEPVTAPAISFWSDDGYPHCPDCNGWHMEGSCP
jgi:hypothetical protein